MAEVNQISSQCLGEHLIVGIGHLLRNTEEVVLTDMVLGIEEAILLIDRVLEWVSLREEVSLKVSIMACLRWIN